MSLVRTRPLSRRLPRAAPLAAAAVLALLLHGVLLGLVPLGAGFGLDEAVRPVMRARQIVLAPPQPAPPPAAPARRARAPAATQAKRVAAGPDEARAADAPAPALAPPAEPAPAPVTADRDGAPPAAEPPAEAVAPIDAGAAPPPPAAEAGGVQMPTYATRLPPAAVLRFELRRAGLSGEGELAWQPRSDGYAMVMNARAFGLQLITWASDGGYDPHGLAPTRFVDQRRARDVRAANFQREAGKITFSGPPVEYPLVPGAQDRLSWMVQLPAIVAAAPEAFPDGTRIPLFVVGARGDGDVWTFVVQGTEPVETHGGTVGAAVRLLREPRKPFDTRVEVWLDPARHHLPVRVKLTLAQTGEGNEFVLREMTVAPGS